MHTCFFGNILQVSCQKLSAVLQIVKYKKLFTLEK